MRIALLTCLLGTLCYSNSHPAKPLAKPSDTTRLGAVLYPGTPLHSSSEKASEWVTRMQHTNGLVESAAHTNFVSLYDNALAALLFIESGRPEHARRIFDYFQNRLESEFEQTGGGFYQFRDTLGTGGSRVWMGDNAWLLIALRQYKRACGSNKYDGMMAELEAWLRSLQEADGGLLGGRNEDGSPIARVTEGMITAYAAVSGFDAFHQNLLAFLQRERWDKDGSVLLTERTGGRYDYALDLHTLSVLIWGNPATRMLESADRYHNTQRHSVNGQRIKGYCFDSDRDVVWLEGSAQMALAFGVTGQEEAWRELLVQLDRAAIPSILFPDLQALPYAANPGSNFGRDTLWPHADQKPAISATVWHLFARRRYNPFDLGESPKPMPGAIAIP